MKARLAVGARTLVLAVLIHTSGACSRLTSNQSSPTYAATTGLAPTAARTIAEITPTAQATGPTVVETVTIQGFENAATNDPEIRRLSDGSVLVVFNCMPPCFEPNVEEIYTSLGPYEGFGRQMQAAVGVEVSWEDREFFLLRAPKPDTIAKLREFIVQFGQRRRAALGLTPAK